MGDWYGGQESCNFIFQHKNVLMANSLLILIITSMVLIKYTRIRGADSWQDLYVKRFLKNWGPYVFKILCDLKECGGITNLARNSTMDQKHCLRTKMQTGSMEPT